MMPATERWLAIGKHLGIEVIAPFDLELAGVRTRFAELLPQFGAPRGMVVDGDSDAIWPHRKQLLAAGYGFSCVELNDTPDANPPLDMFADWGWCSDSPKPDWLGS